MGLVTDDHTQSALSRGSLLSGFRQWYSGNGNSNLVFRGAGVLEPHVRFESEIVNYALICQESVLS